MFEAYRYPSSYRKVRQITGRILYFLERAGWLAIIAAVFYTGWEFYLYFRDFYWKDLLYFDELVGHFNEVLIQRGYLPYLSYLWSGISGMYFLKSGREFIKSSPGSQTLALGFALMGGSLILLPTFAHQMGVQPFYLSWTYSVVLLLFFIFRFISIELVQTLLTLGVVFSLFVYFAFPSLLPLEDFQYSPIYEFLLANPSLFLSGGYLVGIVVWESIFYGVHSFQSRRGRQRARQKLEEVVRMIQKEEYRAAIRRLEEILLLDPELCDGYWLLAEIYFFRGQKEKAKPLYSLSEKFLRKDNIAPRSVYPFREIEDSPEEEEAMENLSRLSAFWKCLWEREEQVARSGAKLSKIHLCPQDFRGFTTMENLKDSLAEKYASQEEDLTGKLNLMNPPGDSDLKVQKFSSGEKVKISYSPFYLSRMIEFFHRGKSRENSQLAILFFVLPFFILLFLVGSFAHEILLLAILTGAFLFMTWKYTGSELYLEKEGLQWKWTIFKWKFEVFKASGELEFDLAMKEGLEALEVTEVEKRGESHRFGYTLSSQERKWLLYFLKNYYNPEEGPEKN